jgi:molybdate transport system substrate-binding protein
MKYVRAKWNKMVRNCSTATRLIEEGARGVTLIPAILTCLFPGSVVGADLRIAAPNAVKEVVSDAAARYERASGNRTVFTWSGSEAIAKRVGDGEVFDVVLNTPQNLDTLAKANKIVPGTRVDFAKSGIGVAVPAGRSRPDVSNEEALRKALLEAKSIGISSGPSGRYLAQLFQRLGIANQVQSKIKQPPSGVQIAELLSSGQAELGFQQISELQHASGVEYLGPLPAGLQSYTIWSGGVHSAANDAAAGRTFLNTLTSSDSAATIRKAGMDPM